MYRLHTKKQLAYFDEAVRLHMEKGYSFEHVARILPISSTTVSDWVRIFVAERGKTDTVMSKNKSKAEQSKAPSCAEDSKPDTEALQRRIAQLEKQLQYAEIRAEFLDEMINVAESMFNIPIRKKAGARQ